MIKFENVTEKTFSAVYEKMVAAFPLEERRTFSNQQKCLNNRSFEFYEIIHESNPVGFIGLWNLNGFVFVEHLAIDEDKRSGGFGTKAIELVKEKYNKPIILEAEAPVTPQQIKRISFYERLGFNVNDYPYLQPSYHGGEGVPLKILSFPSPLTEAELVNFKKETLNSAYNMSGDKK